MAQVAADIAKDHGLTCKIMERDECTKLGMGAYLGVAQGAFLCVCVCVRVCACVEEWIHGVFRV